MKKITIYGLFILLSIIFFSACGSSQTAAEKKQLALGIENAVAMPDFTFKANYAFPASSSSIYLSTNYGLKVSADTVQVYLPYYGRAYRAPLNPSEGGYNFTSTDFKYKLSRGKRNGQWQLNILFNDLDRQVEFYFDVWDNGTARLNVNDINRQTISYQGNIIPKKE